MFFNNKQYTYFRHGRPQFHGGIDPARRYEAGTGVGLDAIHYRDIPDEGRHDRRMFPFPYENDTFVRTRADIIAVFPCRDSNCQNSTIILSLYYLT